MGSSPTHYPSTPKRPTAPRYSYYTTPSPPICPQYSTSRPRLPISPLNDQVPVSKSHTRRVSKCGNPVFSDPRTPSNGPVDDPVKSLLRQKFRARCLERAVKAREEQIRRRRRCVSGSALSDASSDGFDETMDDDVEEDDDTVMQDELFRRIVESSARKERHSYRVSYALEVGSSFDPDMEDVGKWETELRESSTSSGNLPTSEDLPSPPALDDENELAAYAEELAALAAFEDIPEEELFSWSDFEDEEEKTTGFASPAARNGPTSHEGSDDAMCIN